LFLHIISLILLLYQQFNLECCLLNQDQSIVDSIYIFCYVCKVSFKLKVYYNYFFVITNILLWWYMAKFYFSLMLVKMH